MASVKYTYEKYSIDKNKCSIYFSDASLVTGDIIYFDVGINQSGNSVSSGYLPYGGYLVSGSGVNFGSGMRMETDSLTVPFNDFCIVSSTTKTGVGTNIVFGALSKNTGVGVIDGFNIGFNDANRFFIETYSVDGPIIETSKNILAQSNIWAVNKTSNAIYFHVLDPYTLSVKTESWTLPNTSFWQTSGDYELYMGRTDYHAGSVKTGDYSYNNDYLVKSFLYHAESLDSFEIKKLMTSFETNLEYFYISGSSTGTTGSYYEITGSTYTPLYSGKITGYAIVEVEVPFIYPTLTGDTTVYRKVFQKTGLTGLVITGYELTYLYNSGGYGSTPNSYWSSGYFVSDTGMSKYYKDSISYIGNLNNQTPNFSFGVYSTDTTGIAIESNLAPTISAKNQCFMLGKSYPTGSLNVYLNGDLLDEGYFTYVRSGYYSSLTITGGDYAISGAKLTLSEEVSSDGLLFNGIPLAFNGETLTYNGNPYTLNYSYPCLFDNKEQYNSLSTIYNTSGVLGIYGTTFVHNSTVYFNNNKRIYNSGFIEHASQIDLITGFETLIFDNAFNYRY